MKLKKAKNQPSNLVPEKTADKVTPLPTNSQYAGPVIRIRKTNSCEVEYRLINKADKKGVKSSSKRLKSNMNHQPALPTVTPTISPVKYFQSVIDDEANTANWKCFICGRKSDELKMGDLYGPYFADEQYSLYLPDSSGNLTAAHLTEVWLHEDCLVWTPNVLLLQEYLLNFDTALKELDAVRCLHCLKPRATMACCHRGCPLSALHFPCARELACQLDERTFTVYCRKHKAPDTGRKVP